VSSGERRHDIDGLRAIGMFLVFIFHTLQPFNPNEAWHIHNDQSIPSAGWIIWFLNIWLMQFFMLIAGSSVWFSLKKRTLNRYAAERVTRIGLPLLFGILVIVPPQVYLERINNHQFQGSFFEFYPHFFEGIYPQGNFSWHHLWFLVYLLFYSIISIPIFAYFTSVKGQTFFPSPPANSNAHQLCCSLHYRY
jgi:glucans biosynthesis protein C